MHDYEATGIYEVCLTVANTYGQHTWCDSLEVNCLTSSTDIPTASSVQVQPNPTSGTFQIVNHPSHLPIVRIFNIQGERVSFEQNSKTISLDHNGTFIIQVFNQNQWITSKLVVQPSH